jgi:exopolyphosphatase/guanosine-5'-triphosphate,3'-diphosphate pyrophosphatase
LLTHDQYHKHGAYVLEHSDLPGYSRNDQQFAVGAGRAPPALVPGRCLCPSAQDWARRHAACAPSCVWRWCCIAVAATSRCPRSACASSGSDCFCRFPPGWLDEHPLTVPTSQMEARQLRKAGFDCEIGRSPVTLLRHRPRGILQMTVAMSAPVQC